VTFAGSGKRLVTINDVVYTNDDFKNWWRHWNDKNDLDFPATPGDFIDFQLMVQQGHEMGYDSAPNYMHKLDVFLQVRAMMALKGEEVDSKAAVTAAELKKYFDENYSKIWALQILAFDTEVKAQNAYKLMLPFQGQTAGRLVFADLYGGKPEEKADTYDEPKVSAADFHKNKKDSWLAVVRKLAVGEVSAPFLNEENNRYILLRLVDIQPAGEGAFAEKRQGIGELLNKEKRNALTVKLIEDLKKKHKVQVDHELVKTVKFDVDYPEDFLEKQVVSATDFAATVRDLIYNSLKEKKLRKGVADEVIKDMVVSSIISQTLISKESLARGYEKRPPLRATYEFYQQNRLRAEVENGMMSSIVLSDQDLQNYYDLHAASFSVPEKVTFYLLKGDADVLKKLWIGTLQGGDVSELAQKYALDAHSQSQEVAALPPGLATELKKLDKGGVSLPFALDGSYGLLKLIDRLPGQVTPLAEVKSQVVEQLKKEKFAVIKAEYLSKLKSRSTIAISEGVWNDLKRELSNGKKA